MGSNIKQNIQKKNIRLFRTNTTTVFTGERANDLASEWYLVRQTSAETTWMPSVSAPPGGQDDCGGCCSARPGRRAWILTSESLPVYTDTQTHFPPLVSFHSCPFLVSFLRVLCFFEAIKRILSQPSFPMACGHFSRWQVRHLVQYIWPATLWTLSDSS